MNQIIIGKFIAELRHEQNMTQEALGEKIGVTNKTVSRWENGNYMPDIETLQMLSKEFEVSINELLSGRRLDRSSYIQKAEENIVEMLKESRFSLNEKIAFWKRKWVREHIVYLILIFAAPLAAVIVACCIYNFLFIAALPVILFVLRTVVYNQMMGYVEKRAFD